MVGAGAAEGLDGRLQHAQADARPGRAAHDRRHHARRVPQVRREGRRPRASLPAGPGRPPSVEEAIGILRGLKERYEVHHGVRITDSALVAAAVLSDRYITARFLPDKAIDLIDEAASPADRDRLDARGDRRTERRRIQLEIEREALRKESDERSRERLEDLERELADVNEEIDASPPAGSRRRRRSPASARPSSRSRTPGPRPTGPSDPATCRRRPNCATGACPSWRTSSPPARSSSRSCTSRGGCCPRRSPIRTWPRWCPAGPGSPSPS
jgi:hypothetical protein